MLFVAIPMEQWMYGYGKARKTRGIFLLLYGLPECKKLKTVACSKLEISVVIINMLSVENGIVICSTSHTTLTG